MWEGLQTIYGGDKNVQRAKLESLKGKFDDMRMEEGENISQCVTRIKEVVSAIKGATGHIDDDIFLIKVLRKLLPIYAIRVSAIQELRCILGNNLTLEGLVGRLTAFELSNFDNYKPKSLESTFMTKFLLKESNEKKQRKKRRIKHVSSKNDIDEEDLNQLEALLVRRFLEEKENLKVSYPSFVLIAMKQDILLQSIHRRRTKKKEKCTRT